MVLHMAIEGAQLGVLEGTFGTYNGLVWDVSSILTVSGKVERPMMELLESPGVSIGSPSSCIWQLDIHTRVCRLVA